MTMINSPAAPWTNAKHNATKGASAEPTICPTLETDTV
jgi:hypothetical protein